MNKIFDLKNRTEKLALSTYSAPSKPIIAVCGLMNAGKSYLLNMLTQNIDQEYFKTADQRETTANSKLETEHYIYLDTPGLDANAQDDAMAHQGIDDADIVLFVHQPQGELDPSEMDFLLELKNRFGASAEHCITIVLSKIDKESPEKIEAISQAIHKQCQAHLGIELSIFQISNTRYKTGISQKKNALVQASHIDALQQHLDTIQPIIHQTRQVKLATTIESLLQEMNAVEQELQTQKSSIQQDIEQRFSNFNQQMDQLNTFLKESISNYQKI